MIRRLLRGIALAWATALPVAAEAAPAVPFSLRDGDRVVFLGDTFIEREQRDGWIELCSRPGFRSRTWCFGISAGAQIPQRALHASGSALPRPVANPRVASSEAYPQIEPGQPANDKIIVVEDTSGAGRADASHVFAEGLLIPTGLEPGDGGLYVAQNDQLLHLADTDGDGRADRRRIVLSGFGTEDSHHNLHTLRWAPDGRLAMNQSVYTRSAVETPHGVVRLSGGGVFRFDPRAGQLEVLFRGWGNPWGHAFDAFGQSFVTDGTGSDGIVWAIPGATHSRGRASLPGVSPSTYPKFCGIEVIQSPHFPMDWQGDMITCDFRAHRIVRFKVTDRDSSYLAREMPDVLRTTASSFRPVDVKLGPDGALYVADWSNPIIQQGEVDFRDPRRDKTHGRIWRIAVKGRAVAAKIDLTRLGTTELLDKLVSAHRYEVDHARRVVIERGSAAVGPVLARWIEIGRMNPRVSRRCGLLRR